MALEKYKLIGKRIRQAREERGMNQAELAEAIGFSAPSVTYFETGKRRISIEDLEKVAEVLRRPITYFLSEEPLDERTQVELEKKATLEEIKDMLKKIEGEEKLIEEKAEECAEKEFDVTKTPGYIPIEKFKPLPIVGQIHAGELHEAIQDAEETLPIPANADADYALRVYGDSMEPYYNEGDVVVVKETSEAYNGAHVVASVDDEVTLKTYYQYDDIIVLRSANPKYPDISGKEIGIMGVIKGVMYKALMRPASEINGKPKKR
jgi:SOS-response transcriptional repressor LexA